MKADFTRETFNAAKHYYRVLMQQGRVQLDADWNEQAAITLHRLEMLARDLIGPFGTPASSPGFSILDQNADGTPFVGNFAIGAGRLYVDGLLCENDELTTYSALGQDPVLKTGRTYLVFLDVWEQYVSAIEDSSIEEPALGGADTAGRSRIQWQVRAAEVDPKTTTADFDLKNEKNTWDAFVLNVRPENRGLLKARAPTPLDTVDSPPQTAASVSQYRGAENQLYRVEIHEPGVAGTSTFKWSRENGSVFYAIKSGTKEMVTLASSGRDERLRLKADDWVELLDSVSAARNLPGPLLRVTFVDAMKRQVSLHGGDEYGSNADYRFLRRWDSKPGPGGKAGAIPISESNKHNSGWVPIEDGIEVQFQAAPSHNAHHYNSGDYWLIPARVATSGIEWPTSHHGPEALPPAGIRHSYAPLALISLDGAGIVRVNDRDCRALFFPLLKV